MAPRKRTTAKATGGTPSSLPTKPAPSVTVHPRVSMIEDQIVRELARQTNRPETTIWGDCASEGLLTVLINCGPDQQGLYGGRWTAKELAQIVRRRILNVLIDFQYEQDELPGVLRDYIATLKFLVEQRVQGAPGRQPAEEFALTEADEMVFSMDGTDAKGVNQSLGGMGFSRLDLTPIKST